MHSFKKEAEILNEIQMIKNKDPRQNILGGFLRCSIFDKEYKFFEEDDDDDEDDEKEKKKKKEAQ